MVPAGGGEMGRGYCKNWVIDPQGKSGNLGKIRSMHFRSLLLLAVKLFPGRPGGSAGKWTAKYAPNLSAPTLCPCFRVP